jgi:hypothetical protein
MNDRLKRRIFGSDNKNINNNIFINKQDRNNSRLDENLENCKLFYNKKTFVDYDVMICIPSFDRYEKIFRLLNQFYKQPTNYTFKIILLNDGSNDEKYDTLISEFNDIIYIKNETSNSKMNHWRCYNQMWNFLKNKNFHALLQLDDDFILSDNFLDTIMNLFFEKRSENYRYVIISPHLWSNKEYSEHENWWTDNTYFIDGIALIDESIISLLNYELKPVDANVVCVDGHSANAWSQIGDLIKKIKYFVYRTNVSLVYHDGNDNSKLHYNHRKKNNGKVYTQKYIGNL